MSNRMKQSFFLMALCCILCACQTDNALSEPTIQPEKTPQQILEEQPIDDTHDAFLVDTGGNLGTLLVTAELTERSKAGSGAQDITFSVWNPAEMEQPMQTFLLETYMGILPKHQWIVDANFDGFQDFGYLYIQGNQPAYSHFWLWNEEETQFIYCAPLAEISMPEFDAERQIVTGEERTSGLSRINTFHRWIDGELTLVRKIEVHLPNGDDGASLVTVDDLIDGQMVEVYRTEWNWTETSGDALYQKWFDLDYHGEPSLYLEDPVIQPEKTPQQILLEEQLIDETHDAFLVDTGGRLGTLLITVEWDEENKEYDYDALLHFAVWDLAHMDTPLQTMEAYSCIFHWSEVTDANFDGHQDFGYMYAMGNQPTYWNYWLWDEEQAQFVYCAPLAEISDPVFDEQRQVVTGYNRSSAMSGVDTISRWIDGELVLVREIETHYPEDDGTQFMTVKDLIDGQMTEVYRTQWGWTEAEIDIYSKWCDLDYHGEPTEGP